MEPAEAVEWTVHAGARDTGAWPYHAPLRHGLAVRAIWDAWQHGTPLDIRGPHYNINLVEPLFVPAPL